MGERGERKVKKVRYVISFTAWVVEGAEGEWEEVNRLRGLLKVAGRRFGMRCESMSLGEEVPVRAKAGEGKGFVCAGWRSRSGQGRFWG